jgi:MoxR-like ATPase
MNTEEASKVAGAVLDEVSRAVIADRQFLATVLTGVVAGGHVLLEDVPGTGKTLTARSLAGSLGLSFKRIQFTPDLLPGDITGSNVYDEGAGEFEFAPGPIFANVVLADEINRAPPKTQAALLEAMGEGQVSVDGETYMLPEPFFVIATQNPVEQEGTFGLPEAQRDRFTVKSSIGYPDRAGERELLDRRADRSSSIPEVSKVISGDRVRQLRQVPETVRVAGKMRDYIVDLGRATRQDSRVDVGVSPRGIQHLFEVARAFAAIQNREYVVPDDVKRMLQPVFAHRLVLTAEAGIEGASPRDVVSSIADSVTVPSMDG